MPNHSISVRLRLIALSFILFAVVGCEPSPGVIQTAIAQTEAAQPDLVVESTQPAATTVSTSVSSEEEVANVVGIVDGDTIDVALFGDIVRVRYIGVNTPERNETCYQEAKAANAALVENQTVTLHKDQSNTDKYGRLLRFVYIGDVFVNAELVRTGYAEAVEYKPDISMADFLEGLESQARAQNLACYATGIFGDAQPVPAATQPPQGYDTNADGKITCADFTTHADAQAAYDAGVTSLDGSDKDGKACETLP